MDELNSSFGKLSTSAEVWRPRGAAASAAAVPSSTSSGAVPPLSPRSDLKASRVKEFVPGRAWTTSESAAPSQGK